LRCPECGAEGQDSARFCLKCGQALTQSPPKRRSRVRQRLWWMLPMGIGMFLAAVVVSALLLWLKPPTFDRHDVGEVSRKPNTTDDSYAGDAASVTTKQVLTDVTSSEQSTTEPTARSTAAVSPTATVRSTVTSSPTATPPPSEEGSEKQEYMIYVPVVMRRHSLSRR
jgi:hypothetical protein